jgi:hypothetical protein
MELGTISSKDASITCGDFTINFDANQLQVGILDGMGQSYDGITGVAIPNANIQEPMATEFLSYTKESRTCGKDGLNLRLFPKNYQLYCFRCDADLFPISLTKYNGELDEYKEFVKIQDINKPLLSNAKVREYQSEGRGPNKHHGMDFIFEYQGQKYSLTNQNTYVPADLPKAEVDKYIKDFEKLVEDFEVGV